MYNRYYLPLEKGVALDLNPNYPRIFLLSLVEIGQVIVKNIIYVFCLFCDYLLLEKEVAFI